MVPAGRHERGAAREGGAFFGNTVMACRIRKNDVVQVIRGDHRGARGKVLRIDPQRELVVVEENLDAATACR